MSLRLDYRPSAVRPSLLILIFVATGVLSTWSRAVYHPRVDAVYMLVVAALATILGNLVFVTGAGLPMLLHLAHAHFAAKQRGEHLRQDVPRASSSSTYSVQSLVLRVLELPAADGGRRVSVSHKRLWCLLHPFAFGVFVLCVVIPGYDIGCTVSFAAGLSAMATLEEFRRGQAWKRAVHRKILLVAVLVLGSLLNALMFALSYVALHHVQSMDQFEGATLADHLLTGNFTQVSFYYNNSIVVLDKAELTQYLTGGADDRIRVRMLLWSLAFATPPLLSWTLTPSLSLPENLELARPGVVAWAGSILAIAVLRDSMPIARVIHVQNALGTMYFLFSAFGTAFVVIGLLRLLLMRRSLHASILVHLASVVHLLMYNGLSLNLAVVVQLSVAVAVIACVYAVVAVLFIRHENVAVRQGWGGRVPDDRFSIAGESDDLDLEDHALEDERDIPVHSLDDVMDRVEEELQVTERAILLHTVPGSGEARRAHVAGARGAAGAAQEDEEDTLNEPVSGKGDADSASDTGAENAGKDDKPG